MDRRKNDALLKSAFEECFQDLLRFFYKDAEVLFDVERGFEFMDKELHELFPEPEKKGGSRVADMLVKVYSRNGMEEWLLIHLEIQGQNDAHFAKRMFQYFYRIYDRYDVPVTAWAVFTGSKKPIDNIFAYSFLGTENTYRYNALHILDYTEAELLAMDNRFALVVLAAQKALLMGKVPEEELAVHRLTIARTLIQSKRYNGEQIGSFIYFLKTFIYIRDSEINIKFDNEIHSLTGNEKTMGILETIKQMMKEEGVEIGLEKGREETSKMKDHAFVKSLLLNSDFDDAKIALMVGVPMSLVQEVKQELSK